VILVLDGREDIDGRALLLMSALHHVGPDLHRFRLRFADVASEAVRLAINLLRWDLGLDAAESPDAEVEANLPDTRLYLSISFAEPTWPRLAQMKAAGVPTLAARQFPPDIQSNAEAMTLTRAAHDPKVFATRLARTVRHWA
jgi:hypothetical protein